MLRIITLIFCLILSNSICAQVLDEEEPDISSVNVQQNVQNNDVPDAIENNVSSAKKNSGDILYTDDEALFYEMFNEKDGEQHIAKPDNIDRAIEEIESINKNQTQNQIETPLPDLEGGMEIGLTKGSYRIFRDMLGKVNCSFSVILKSTLNRNIKKMSLRLVYKHRVFAFIFRDVKENGFSEQFITTTGDICYNLGGVPDIKIDICKIKGVLGSECIQHIKWLENIEKPVVEDK